MQGCDLGEINVTIVEKSSYKYDRIGMCLFRNRYLFAIGVVAKIFFKPESFVLFDHRVTDCP